MAAFARLEQVRAAVAADPELKKALSPHRRTRRSMEVSVASLVPDFRSSRRIICGL